jgi:hypothetical protein
LKLAHNDKNKTFRYYTIDFKEFSRIYDKKSFFESDSVSLMLKLNKPHGFTTDIDVSLAINLDNCSLIIDML